MEGPVQPDLNLMDTAVMSEAELEKALRMQLAKQFAAQQKAISDQEALARAAIQAKTPQVDLTPFYAAIRQFEGYKDAGDTYVAPKNDIIDTALGLEKQKRSAQDTYSDNMTNALRNMLSEKLQDRRHQQTMSQLAMSERNAQVREMEKVVPRLLKLGDEGKKYTLDLANVEQTLNKDKISVAELNNVITKFGRLMGEAAVQTDRDSLRAYTPTLEAKYEELKTRFGEKGVIDRNDPGVQAMLSQVKIGKQAMADALKSQATIIKDSYGAPDAPTNYLFKEGQSGAAGYNAIMNVVNTLTPKEANATTGSGAPSSADLEAQLQAVRAERAKRKASQGGTK